MHIPIVLPLALLQICVYTVASQVTNLSPTWGGAGGDVKITLTGQGFSANQFSYGAGQENLGNKVSLFTEKETHVCKIHPNDCTQTQIVCYTPKGLEYNTEYSLYVTVDGVKVTDICSRCKFTPRRWATPEFTSVTPVSGEVGELLLEMHGRIFTATYGSNLPGVDKILRIYGAKGENCNPYQAKDEFYKLEMDTEPEGTNKGTIQCKPEKTYVGGFEPRIITTAPYGGSVFSDNLYRVSRKGVRYVVQSYTAINGISPSTGSEEGGTRIRINGGEFDANFTYTDARVYVGDEVCSIVELKASEYIDCVVPAKKEANWFAGNRGALVETFDGTFSTYEEARDTTVVASGIEWHDETKYCAPVTNKWTRMRFVFDCPGTGNWDFFIWADEGAKIYIDDDNGVDTTGSTWRYVGRKIYNADQKVKMVIVGKPGTIDTSCVQVRAFFRNTTVLPNKTSNSVPETQKLVINSTVKYENFTLKFSDFSETTPVNTKQKVCIDGGSENVRLGLFGAYTVMVDLSGDVTAIQTALDNLPFKAAEEKFSVVRDTATCVVVTLESTRGNIPLLETDPSNGYTVESVTQGKSNNLDIAFQFKDTPSPLIRYDPSQKAAFAVQIKTALEKMLGVQCPSTFSANAKFIEDFEAQPSSFGDAVTAELTPFCGRFSCENCKTLYSAATANKQFTFLTESKWLCFAARGLDNDDIRLKFSNKPDKSPVLNSKFVIKPENIKEDGEWKYKCIDIQDAFNNKNWGLENTLGFVLVEASVGNIDTTNDFYVDEVFIGQTSPLATLLNTPLNKLRMPIAYPNVNKKTTTDWVSVVYNNTEDNYAVSIAPFECGYNFELLTLSGSNVASISNSVATSTFTDISGKMVTTRTSQTQRPISGKFKITYNGTTSAEIEAFNLTEEALKGVLETSVEELGTLSIERSEDSTCAYMEFTIKLMDRPGDRPLMTVTDEFQHPSDANAFILPSVDGYYYHELLRDGDILTYHTQPQVRVYINDVATKCKLPNNECTFSWSTDATPTVTSLDKTTGSDGETLTITGTNFDATSTKNLVKIGGVDCVVTSSSSDQIVCTIGNGELGTHPVVVNVEGKGKAICDKTFTQQATFQAINPQTSTLGGNINATITGKGFSKDMVVKFGDVNCVNMWYEDSSTVYCQVPAYHNLAESSSQMVTVTFTSGNGVVIPGSQTFTYTVQSGVEITKVSTNGGLTVHGEQTLIIEGTAMGTNGKVMLGSRELKVLSRTDTLITAETPRGITAGAGQQLLVFYGTEGAILQSTSIPTLDVNLKLTGVSPQKGSLIGGTKLTLTGTGFGNVKDNVTVTIGGDDDKNQCIVKNVENQKVICVIEDTRKNYTINNEDCDKAPFCFNKKHLEIRQQDSVIFSWKTPSTLTTTAFNIFETESLESKVPKDGGFTTGTEKLREGRHLHRFVDIGTRYILACDENCVNVFRMIIDVVPMESATKTIHVTVVGQEAEAEEPPVSVKKRASDPVDESGCSITSNDISDCSSVDDATPDFNQFKSTCTQTPLITSVTFELADANIERSMLQTTQVTFNGDGFSSSDCANVAKIGDCPCIAADSTATMFTCTLDSSCDIDNNMYQPISLTVNPLGSAAFNTEARLEKSVLLLPSVTSISPQSGSTEGGTEITITGHVFTTELGKVSVSFGGTYADCKYADYHQIQCITGRKSSAGTVTMSVMIGGIEAKCESDSSCKYQYDDTITPTITSVSPTEISTQTTLTFTGDNLGNDPAKLTIEIAGENCYDVAIKTENTEVTCTVDALPAGESNVAVRVLGKGDAQTSITVTSSPSASVSPTSGSIHGNTSLVFNGFGFTDDITITVNGQDFCEKLTYISFTKVECDTKAHGTAETVSIDIKSNNVIYEKINFEYSDTDTPTLTSIDPATGTVGTAVKLSGDWLGSTANDIDVYIGNAACTDVAFEGADIKCNAGPHMSGDFDVSVTVNGKGRSGSVSFAYTITINSFSPLNGDENGGQEITLSGSGLTESMVVKICDQVCNFEELKSTSEYVCLTPAGQDGESCSVTVEEGNADVITLAEKFTYNKGMSPMVEKIQPQSGGTKGGTQLTLTGDRFSNTMSEVTVIIDGVPCVVTSSSTNQIVCTTGEHEDTKLSQVVVTVNGVRATAANEKTLQFNYADKYSSIYTWGGNPVPVDGEYVVIPEGRTILLDTDTAVLEMLLIQGNVIFDEKDVTLKAKRILIVNGGSLQVGTEEAPFQYKGIIELYGDHRDTELPIYGTKVIAVRNGTLSLYGRPIENTWTLLSQTADVGTDTISVQGPINGWQIGDEVVIATTGGHNSQKQTETGIIKAITGNTITLENPLEYKHLGNTESYTHRDGSTAKVEYRAEVGLLSRNVKVIGKPLEGFDAVIEECPEGFDTGEFKTQTCFQGRFGESTESDQFGATVMFHPEEPANSIDPKDQIVKGQLSYVEFNHAGQAFRLGRYPIHFHLMGQVSGTYVRGCSIHKTFNRAVNIHNSHNVLVEYNIVYNVMGGAVFLEDGIETGNILQYNLVLFVISSTSLLNDDITPASFWITNPNNTVRHNHAAGGTHFGYWFRMHEHPDGPSFTKDVCPRRVVIGVFYNNTAHSFSWFGLWIFEEYYPSVNARCNSEEGPKEAIIEQSVFWNNKKGIELVTVGAVHTINLIAAQNSEANYEIKLVRHAAPVGALVKKALLIGQANLPENQNEDGITDKGIVFPFADDFSVEDTKFINYNDPKSVCIMGTSIDGTCSDKCGAYKIKTSQLEFENAPKRIQFRWLHETVIKDLDGSLCGTNSPQIILPKMDTLPTDKCRTDCSGFAIESGASTSNCDTTVKFTRFGFNELVPKSVWGKEVSFVTTENGAEKSVPSYFRDKRVENKNGWMGLLQVNKTYRIEFADTEAMINMSFIGRIHDMDPNDCLMLKVKLVEVPDKLSVDNGDTNREKSETLLDCTSPSIVTGDWYFEEKETFGYAVIAFVNRDTVNIDIDVKLKVVKCFFEDCITPIPASMLPPPTERPSPFEFWTANIWKEESENNLRTASKETDGTEVGPPVENQDVIIGEDMWVVISQYNPPRLGIVTVLGGLEIDYEFEYNYIFKAKIIIIKGGRFHIGWLNNPIVLGTVNIVLLGARDSPPYNDLDGAPLSNKAMGVYGGLEMIGKDVVKGWLRLAQSVSAGATVLKVRDDPSNPALASWKQGDRIFITSTSTNKEDLEMAIIKDVDAVNGAITLESAVTKRHSGGYETVDGVNIDLGAAVGLLSRTITVEGEVINNDPDAWGGRMLVSVTSLGTDIVSGYARLHNVLFRNMGQDGFREDYDPRHAVSYVNTMFNVSNKPSEVYNCAFEDIYNAAIGVFGTKDINVQGNVILKALGSGIVTSSENTTLKENLVANTYWSAAFDGRKEQFNLALEFAVEAISSKSLQMHDNYVCGSERVGYHIPGVACDATEKSYSNNYGAGNSIGGGIFPDDTLIHEKCVQLSGFRFFKNFDAGLYYHNTLSLVASDNIYADENTAIFPMVIGADPLSHVIGEEYAEVRDSIVIGTSSVTNCLEETEPSGDYIDLSSEHRSSRGPSSERLGLLMAVFTGGKNNCPTKPCFKIMAYNAISGQMRIKDTTFVNFNGESNGCKAAFAVSTLKKNDDANHPVLMSDITTHNVDTSYAVLIHRPNVEKINPADCVDMDCDALKKVLLKDLDGSFLGQIGSVISQSEFQWDGEDRRRGLGDYRIPTSALIDLDGNKMEVNDLANAGRGIVRTPDCVLRLVSNNKAAYYWCPDEDYEMMLIESLDDDTETRRLSPLALFSGGYVDLMNGPQDHGWCNGYTCQKRISTFIAMVLDQTPVDVFFSSTQPHHIRFALIRADSTRCAVVSLFYLNPNRIDVYTNTVTNTDLSKTNYVLPKNGEHDSDGNFRLKIEHGVDYKPTCSDPHGSNYIDREANVIYFVVKGGTQTIHLKRAEVIVVAFGFPAINEEDFFKDDQIVNNIAALLGIPIEKIRILDVVSESSGTGRRRRSTEGGGITVTFEIGDSPTDTVEEDTEDVTDYAATLMNACQTAQIGGALDLQTECDEIVFGDVTYKPKPPAELRFLEEIRPQHEGVPFAVQPKIRAYDTDGNVVDHLGIEESPWEITASLRSCSPSCGHPNAVLTGTLTVLASNGYFNFTDLQISHKGEGYIIDFVISSPANTNLTVSSAPFSVDAVPMTAGVYSMTSGDIPQNSVFSLTLDLQDKSTKITIPDVTWRDHTAFDATCGLVANSQTGTLTGTLSKTFDLTNGRATFDDLVFSGYGYIFISCHVVSTPSEFDLYSLHPVFVLGEHKIDMEYEATENIVLRYDLDFDKTLPTEVAAAQLLQATVEVFAMKYAGIVIRSASISKGSIMISFTMEGKAVNITTTKEELCSELSSGLEVTIGGSTLTLDGYMKVDGVDYYSTCGKKDDDDGGLHPAYIALIVVLCLLVIGIVVFVLVWRFKIRPKSKTHGINDNRLETANRGGFYYIDNGRTVFLGAPNQKVQDILYKQNGNADFRSNSSAPITTLYDELPGKFSVRSSPIPPKSDEDGTRGLTPTGL